MSARCAGSVAHVCLLPGTVLQSYYTFDTHCEVGMGHPVVRPYCKTHTSLATVRRVARIPTKPRNFRATDELWGGAMRAADAAGEHLPDKLREFLAWYQHKPGARMPSRPSKSPNSADR